jgi:predicted RNA-binding Zn ribbon-like protein
VWALTLVRRSKAVHMSGDPRPLLGEPLALDLLNTRWISATGPRDLLSDTDGLAVWLHSAGLDREWSAGAPELAALRQARDALVAVVTDPADAGPLNEVLDHGRIRRTVVDGLPADQVEIADPAWGPAWLAADDFLRLLRERPDRIRECANPECILHFYDVSKNGTRRWCAMAACGNRTKSARHYERVRGNR